MCLAQCYVKGIQNKTEKNGPCLIEAYISLEEEKKKKKKTHNKTTINYSLKMTHWNKKHGASHSVTVI